MSGRLTDHRPGGWSKCEAQAWADTVALLAESGAEFTEPMIRRDLRYQYDQVRLWNMQAAAGVPVIRRRGLRKMGTCRENATRWGLLSDKGNPLKNRAAAYMADEGWWWDDAWGVRDNPGTSQGQSGDNPWTGADGKTPNTDENRDNPGTVSGQPGDSSGNTRVRRPSVSHVDTSTQSPQPPTGGKAPEADDEPRLPKWTKRVTGASPSEALTAIAACVQAVKPKANPQRMATDAKSVLALWRALERPPLGEFVPQFVAVAKAAKSSPHPLFARDIRAEGWDRGHDRSGDVATIAVQQRWSARLEQATAEGWLLVQSEDGEAPDGGVWDELMAERRWSNPQPRNWPALDPAKLQQGRWRLAADDREHWRRVEALNAAGGWKAWVGATNNPAPFRAAFLAAYAKQEAA